MTSLVTPLMTPLAIIRHGPTAWTEENRIQGHSDIPLSPEGRDMVSGWKVPTDLAAYDWVASPLARARETAVLLSGREPAIEPRLKEMSYGEWEGLCLPDLRTELGDEMAENEARGLDFQAPGGESPRNLQDRLRPWLAEVAAQGRPTLAVAHHGVLRAIVSLATGWTMADNPPEKLQWGAAHIFRLADDGGPSVERLNVSLEKP